MKSIVQDKKECYLCRYLDGVSNTIGLELHHMIHGTANRKLADKHGLTVWLCYSHHRTGNIAVHRDKETDMFLKTKAQRTFEEKHSREEWMQIFGRNYL